MPAQYRSAQKIRLEIAQVAARMIAVDGINDYFAAKKKAALQLGVTPGKNMPTNSEIEKALVDYQNLFQTDSQPQWLRRLRSIAADAMKFLHDFSPRLAGPVLSGSATPHSEICLHLFSDEPEQVGWLLDEHGIPFRFVNRMLRKSIHEYAEYPACRFLLEDVPITLVILPQINIRTAVLSPVDGRPMKRANLKELEKTAKW